MNSNWRCGKQDQTRKNRNQGFTRLKILHKNIYKWKVLRNMGVTWPIIGGTRNKGQGRWMKKRTWEEMDTKLSMTRNFKYKTVKHIKRHGRKKRRMTKSHKITRIETSRKNGRSIYSELWERDTNNGDL